MLSITNTDVFRFEKETKSYAGKNFDASHSTRLPFFLKGLCI